MLRQAVFRLMRPVGTTLRGFVAGVREYNGNRGMTVKGLASSGQNYHGIPSSGSSRWAEVRDERYREYRRLWSERPRERSAGYFPLHLDIETTNLCNLRCIMCPRTRYLDRGDRRWSPKGLGHMDQDLYRSIIDQGAAGGAYSVKLNLLGEPLLHPEVVDQVAYAHGHGLFVMMNTNAMLLDEDMSARLLEAGLDDIFFSIDSPDKQTFEKIRVGARFETVLENMAGFVRIKDRLGKDHVQTRASMVIDVLGRTTETQIQDFRRLMSLMGIEEVGFGPADDHLKDRTEENLALKGDFVCEQIYQRVFITWDGVITPCCGHYEREYVIGTALETSLKEAWLGRRYGRLRQAHEAGRFQTIPICRRCSVPYLARRAGASEGDSSAAGPGSKN